MLCSLAIEEVEAIDKVASKIVRGAEAQIEIKTVIVCFERVRDHEVTATVDHHPVRQFVIQRVAVVGYSRLDDQPTCVRARAACHPADAAAAGQSLDPVQS